MKQSDRIIEKTIAVAKRHYAQNVGAIDNFVADSWTSNVMLKIKNDSTLKVNKEINIFGGNWLWNFSMGIAAIAVVLVTAVIYVETSAVIDKASEDNYYNTVMKHSQLNSNVVLNNYLGVDFDGE